MNWFKRESLHLINYQMVFQLQLKETLSSDKSEIVRFPEIMSNKHDYYRKKQIFEQMIILLIKFINEIN